MKHIYNKKTLEGGWVEDDNDNPEFTEKTPPGSNYIYDEEVNDWVLPTVPEINDTED